MDSSQDPPPTPPPKNVTKKTDELLEKMAKTSQVLQNLSDQAVEDTPEGIPVEDTPQEAPQKKNAFPDVSTLSDKALETIVKSKWIKSNRWKVMKKNWEEFVREVDREILTRTPPPPPPLTLLDELKNPVKLKPVDKSLPIIKSEAAPKPSLLADITAGVKLKSSKDRKIKKQTEEEKYEDLTSSQKLQYDLDKNIEARRKAMADEEEMNTAYEEWDDDFGFDAKEQEGFEQEGSSRKDYSLSTSDLDELAAPLRKLGFKGTYAYNSIPLKKYFPIQAYILNTDPSNKPGKHWFALLIDNKNKSFEIYDSSGLKQTKTVMSSILKFVKRISGKEKYQFKENLIRAQSETTSTCGYFALRFLIDRLLYKDNFKKASRYADIEKNEELIEMWERQYGGKIPEFTLI
jgi:hypothetical protein